jgi:WD40 repeat protein
MRRYSQPNVRILTEVVNTRRFAGLRCNRHQEARSTPLVKLSSCLRRATLLLAGLSILIANGCQAKAPNGTPAAGGSNSSAASGAAASVETVEKNGSKEANASVEKNPVPASSEQIAKWAIPSHQPLELLSCYDGFDDSFVQCVALSPNGKQFVLGGTKLTLWNSGESKPTIDLLTKYKPEEIERPICSVAISPNGELLAAGDQKGTLRIWSLADQHEDVSIPAHEGRLTQLVFSPDSKSVATTSYSGEVRIWNATDGTQIKSLPISDQEIVRLAYLSDGLLAVAGRETSIWNVETGKQETTLTKGNVTGPALGLSSDRHLLAYNDADSKTQLWDVQKAVAAGLSLRGASAHWIEFSQDGKWIATYSGDSNIRIWDAVGGQVVQVIDADGDRTAGMRWLPGSNALLVASQQGRVRIWGTAEAAKLMGLQPLPQPGSPPVSPNTDKRSYTSAQVQKIIDIRSFPRLPGATPVWTDITASAYNAPAAQIEVEQFYRYCLNKAGWTEVFAANPGMPGLNFRKSDCELSVSFSPATPPAGRAGDLQISLQFSGNYDARWLPKISETPSTSSYAAFSSVSYRTKADLTDVEVDLLRQFHQAGWTAYTRLGASSAEQSRSRNISLVQGGSVLTVSIGYPADSTTELYVQTSVSLSNKSLPIPPDCGWIEFDSSTDLQLVANTQLDLAQTVKFFDTEMAKEGWIPRDAGRRVKDGNAFLPFVRGQQDVLLRLVTLPASKARRARTQIIVGEAERFSWQLEKPKPADSTVEKNGIQAADFPLPKGANAVKYEVDQKQIQFEISDVTPPKLAEQFSKQLAELGWQRETSGVTSDEYVLVTFKKEKSEIEIRIRAEAKKSTAMIGGDGLHWSKPLPTPAVRVSYETWLRRGHKEATLDRLDEFLAEMHKLPAVNDTSK